MAIGIIAALAVLLFPAYRWMKVQGEATRCMSNLRNYGVALIAYTSDNNGLPWWNGQGGDKGREGGSTAPTFEPWVRPYLHKQHDARLRCPLASEQIRKDVRHRFNYAGNGALCIYYPTLKNLPVAHSRVVLAAENYTADGFNHSVHFNMTVWALGEGPAYGTVESFAQNENKALAQYHGSAERRGLHFMFLDGHAELVTPAGNDWRAEPVFGTATNGGYFYSRDQLKTMNANPERY